MPDDPRPIAVAFVSRQRVVGPTNGSSAYLLDLARAVRDAGMTPHLVQPSPSLMGRTPLLRMGPELDVFATHRIRGVVKRGRRVLSVDPALYAATARGILARLGRKVGLTANWTRDQPAPYSVAVPWTDADRAFVADALRGADVVLADYFYQAEAFALAPPGAARGIVMHDLFHARAGSSIAGEAVDSVTAVTREAELAALARADAVVAIQRAEADFVRTNLPALTVIEAPMAARAMAEAPTAGDARRLLFVGSGTAPNLVGLRWFFEHVWPRVLAAVPDMTLDIAGTVGPALEGDVPAGVRVLGLVDDLAPLYAAAGIVVSPLTFGSGLKIKLVEALAQGKAIVATGVTLQGAEDCAAAVIRADDPAAFADAIVNLARDEPSRLALAAAALDAARSRFSPEACYAAFVAWLRTAAGAGA